MAARLQSNATQGLPAQQGTGDLDFPASVHECMDAHVSVNAHAQNHAPVHTHACACPSLCLPARQPACPSSSIVHEPTVCCLSIHQPDS